MLVKGLSARVESRPNSVLRLDGLHARLRPNDPSVSRSALYHRMVVVIHELLVNNLVFGVLHVVLFLHVLKLFFKVVRVSWLAQIGVFQELVGCHRSVGLPSLAVDAEVPSFEEFGILLWGLVEVKMVLLHLF